MKTWKKVILFITLLLLMLVTGVFWGTWFPLTRSIEGFSPAEFIHIGQVIIANVAVPMSILMPSAIIFIFISIMIAGRKDPSFYYGLTSLILIIIVLIITVTILVPIDMHLKSWTESTVPPDFIDIRNKWSAFHALRTLLSVLSFSAYSVFLILQLK